MSFASRDLRYIVLDGTQSDPVLVDRQRAVIPDVHSVSEYVRWVHTQIGLILDKFQPDRVAYRMTLNATKLVQIHRTYYGEAILQLCCDSCGLSVDYFLPQSIVPSRLGLPKEISLRQHVDDILGEHPPYWDDRTRDTALVAWFELEG
jgi:hypothetical protein